NERRNWIEAVLIQDKKVGYVPKNYITKDTGTIQLWFFDVTRSESQKLLLLPINCIGSYLIRPSSDGRNYALSLLTVNEKKEKCIKHYLIENHLNGCVFISTKKFQNIPQLIQHFTANDLDGRGAKLVVVCPRLKVTHRCGPVVISKDEITDLEKIASGHYGHVFKGKLNKCLDVAVKIVRSNRISPEDFVKEADMLNKLNHRRIVTLYNICINEKSVWIVTEFMKNGSLRNLLRSPKGQELKMQELLNIGSQIAEGMVHLESLNIIHRDLRADNVLVGDNYEVKIADFGLAKEGSYETVNFRTKIPVRWTAPEALLHGKFSFKSDVWSFGIVCYELVTYGQVPYPGVKNPSLIQLFKDGGKMEKPSQCEQQFYDQIISPCWSYTPDDRPTFENLFFKLDTYFLSTENPYQ
ncbi:hypothetical protein LOTGIDRAFT_138365, partial [Lottia gigantea]